ncbi:hypothetical protein H671_1g3787 [Cricetulus griseus]|uniref:Uncharacterized protein n=1 Tax=Cricetulus griseus TaxID=10029 RepID=A0A061IMQ6_CRIGR|nr:hypothetical protein H671_1g3787 [Cricetulus griseus]
MEQAQLHKKVDTLRQEKKKLQENWALLKHHLEDLNAICKDQEEETSDLKIQQQQELKRLEERLDALLQQKEKVIKTKDLPERLQHHFDDSQMRVRPRPVWLVPITAPKTSARNRCPLYHGTDTGWTPAHMSASTPGVPPEGPENMEGQELEMRPQDEKKRKRKKRRQPWPVPGVGQLNLTPSGVECLGQLRKLPSSISKRKGLITEGYVQSYIICDRAMVRV